MAANGRVLIVGIGSGERDTLTSEALQAIAESDAIVGYKTYTDLIKNLIDGQEVVSSGMGREVDRGIKALELAERGMTVAVISSGDPGVYGMAGVMLELMQQRDSTIPVRVIPGLTAAQLAAAALGAPLMNDYAVISLSDLMTPWEVIEKRLDLCAQADMVICLYNPRSHGRTEQIERAAEIISRHQPPDTPVGAVRNAGRSGQEVLRSDLGSLGRLDLDMSSLVVVGNQTTYFTGGKMITPRGYKL
ncbi:MAG: precorrin-3B C(17)-methyltransferase [Firmicutes bacterium]|nr:precorrin-3B C(17)-methyltransferase [Bacillota bacterium]